MRAREGREGEAVSTRVIAPRISVSSLWKTDGVRGIESRRGVREEGEGRP